MHLIVGWNIKSEREVIWLNAMKSSSKEEKLLKPERSTNLP